MDSAKTQLVQRLQSANNILVTVSRNPSVDQLAACIGATLVLNKLGKHATAVFSGQVPSTMEFLEPEQTLEKNTDSLRDFIIALDKSKADKLRYKVEDEMVRIFITPYRTSISQGDLEFSQGDFNVDLVVALGVNQQEDLDEAITAHGRILHDATLSSINVAGEGGLGSINWNDPHASSLTELVADLTQSLGPDLLDAQIATALLTGIVAETQRFSNDKTTPQTMSVSAQLMSAGANQQLVASKLEEPQQPPTDTHDNEDQGGDIQNNNNPNDHPDEPKSSDGELDIDHDEAGPNLEPTTDNSAASQDDQATTQAADADQPVADESATDNAETHPSYDFVGQSDVAAEAETQPENQELPEADGTGPLAGFSSSPKQFIEPPEEAALTANAQPEPLEPSTDPLSLPALEDAHMLAHDTNNAVTPAVAPADAPQPMILPDASATNDLPNLSLPKPADPVQFTPPDREFMDAPPAESTEGTEADTELDLPSGAAVEPPAASEPEKEAQTVAPISPTKPSQLMPTGFTPPPPAWVPPSDGALAYGTSSTPSQPTSGDQTLTEIEAAVHSPHIDTESQDVDEARDEVMKALSGAETTPEPIQALNAQPMMDNLNSIPDSSAPDPLASLLPQPSAPGQPASDPVAQLSSTPTPDPFAETPSEPTALPPQPTFNLPQTNTTPPAPVDSPTGPPPVPPPLPLSFTPQQPPQQ